MTGNAINAKERRVVLRAARCGVWRLFMTSGGLCIASPSKPIMYREWDNVMGWWWGSGTIRPRCFNRYCSNSPRAGKRAGCG